MSKDPSCDSKEETASGTYTSDALTMPAQVPVSLPWRPVGPDSSGDHDLAEEGCVCVAEGVWGYWGTHARCLGETPFSSPAGRG